MLDIGQRFKVELSSIDRIKERISLDELKSGLRKPKLLPWAPIGIDSRDILPTIEELAPLAHDVVPWMQHAAANLAVLSGAAEDYARAGSQIAVAAGDPYIPGVSTTGISTVSVSGDTMRSQGYGQAVLGDSVFNIPAGGKKTLVTSNSLGWASISDIGTGIQWVMNLMNWLNLARSPIGDKLRFSSTNAMVAPQFVMVSTVIPTPLHMLTLGIQSDKTQTMSLTGRSASNYTQDLFNLDIEAPEGESVMTIFVRGIPIVIPYVLEMQPEDDTQSSITTLYTQPM